MRRHGAGRPSAATRHGIAEDRRALGIGTLALIRHGAIGVRGGIARFTREGVVFAQAAGAGGGAPKHSMR